MAGSLAIYPAEPNATLRVHLRDDGQDFLWLDVGLDGRVVGAGPFQAWLWTGKLVRVEQLRRGGLVPIFLNRNWTTLRYPITRIYRRAAKAKAA